MDHNGAENLLNQFAQRLGLIQPAQESAMGMPVLPMGAATGSAMGMPAPMGAAAGSVMGTPAPMGMLSAGLDSPTGASTPAAEDSAASTPVAMGASTPGWPATPQEAAAQLTIAERRAELKQAEAAEKAAQAAARRRRAENDKWKASCEGKAAIWVKSLDF